MVGFCGSVFGTAIMRGAVGGRALGGGTGSVGDSVAVGGFTARGVSCTTNGPFAAL